MNELVASAGVAPAPANPPTHRAVPRHQVRHLATSVMLEETGTPALVRLSLLAVVAIVAAFVGWAAVAHIDEVAATTGSVVPSGRVQKIQHLEGGIVAEILVDEGTLVTQGQVLIRLDPAHAVAEMEQMRARAAALALHQERLSAFGTERDPDFSLVRPEHQPLADAQRTIYEIAVAARTSSAQVLHEQIEQREAELAVLSEQETTLERQKALLGEELAMREELFRKNLSSKIVLLEVQRRVSEVDGALAALRSDRQRLKSALAEARDRLTQDDTELKREALTEMGRVTAELAEVRESLARLSDRVRRLAITAPVAGIVKGLAVRTIGGVIQPGETLMEIVPVTDELIVETRISPRDIGHVATGQPVTVKVSAFDFARYGSIAGVLVDVSASTFLDERDVPYYKGFVRLERPYVGADPERNRILPGMTVQADIDTGSKTLLQYLLKPVYSSMDAAFRER